MLVVGVWERLGVVVTTEMVLRVSRTGRRVESNPEAERWNLERNWKASEALETARCFELGFHSVGSRSDLALWRTGGIE